ncbi:cysteine synthase [Denitrobacterium detoxificans]|uniref:Cysteine synthase A n=1 Tax=Denitrobacterium detoxificans TaxID=79604 RepID=A0A172RZW3_9ACTN|nr:cysteine synthase family protein [Denitrobacterium detoxificans]ANE23249.1 cysteine synthase [Denitrobacterium detoxificans]MBE6466690.1 cysteine synthase family protein [Denitrobacterium detoxificans]SEO37720.1 cysteine synthase A [Denitrobacterium detoxificans]
MARFESTRQLIGNTPIVRLNNVDVPEGVQLYAKLELWNPSGSTKDRIGLAMLDNAEREGRIAPGAAIVEATAGNTGLGIAYAALNRGYKVILVIPTKFSLEKQVLCRALGAEIVSTPREEGMLGAEKRARELRDSIPGAISLEQFRNMSNPRAHYETTGPEIWRDMEGQIDYVVAGAGSGGTYSGVLRYLKEQNPNIKGVLADPIGSTIGGGEHGDYDIEGIGNDFVADTMDMSLVDEVVKVSDDDAFRATRILAAREGIFAGSSSGAALAASLAFAKRGVSGNIVTIFPDRGDRYFTSNLYAPFE